MHLFYPQLTESSTLGLRPCEGLVSRFLLLLLLLLLLFWVIRVEDEREVLIGTKRVQQGGGVLRAELSKWESTPVQQQQQWR